MPSFLDEDAPGLPNELGKESLLERLRRSSLTARRMSTSHAVGPVGTGEHGDARHGQGVLRSGDVDVLSGHEAYVTTPTPSGLRGPRGPHGGGEGKTPEVVPAGLPPAQAGPPRFLTHILKEETRPQTPHQYERWVDTVASGVAKGTVIADHQAGFPIRGMRVSNYSVFWVHVSGLQWIPPLTVNFTWTVWAATNKVTLIADVPPGSGFTTLNGGGTAATGTVIIEAFEGAVVDQPGAVLKLPTQP